MDDVTRIALNLTAGGEYDFRIRQADLVERIYWAWNASDPGYQLSIRLAMVSLALGVLGFALGVFAIWRH